MRLLGARRAVARADLPDWHRRYGLAGEADVAQLGAARRLARHVDRAARRLTLPVKCLPRAMALSIMLRRRAIPHRLVIGARPAVLRTGTDDLHAWIEVGGAIIIGELPGPWLNVHSIPEA